MKLLFLSGSRGEWGYIQPLVDACRRKNISYEICATNMVLLPSYGSLIDDMRAGGYNVTDEIYMSLEGSTRTSMAKSLSVFLGSFVDVLHRVKPTWLVLAGDRGEQLMGAVAAAYTYTPIAHVQAGELSGNIDGVARHAIGKFAHVHFAANADAGERLRKLGEEDFRIHVVGHPALDPIVAGGVTPREVLSKHGVPVEQPYLLVVLHPVTEDVESVETQASTMMDALEKFSMPKVWILSNNDAGAAQLRSIILKRRKADTFLFENLPRADFLGFMKNAACVVGNSSSGLLEAPTFSVPAVNIGRRQWNRVRGSNVIDVSFSTGDIAKAIERGMSETFRTSIAGKGNPYGDGHSTERILKVLQETPLDDRLLVKRLTY